jgi:hypothetical protein
VLALAFADPYWQEKATVFRTEKRRNPHTGASYPWIARATAMVNHFYFYLVDAAAPRCFGHRLASRQQVAATRHRERAA